MPNFLKLTVWTHCPIAPPRCCLAGVTPVGNGKFAARDERRGFAGDRGEIGFGERLHDTGALHRAKRRPDRRSRTELPDEAVPGDERRVVGGERIVVVEGHRGVLPDIHAGAEIDAHLFDDIPPDFRDGYLQHHLVAATNDDRIDDLVGAADQPRGDLAGLLGLDRGSIPSRSASRCRLCHRSGFTGVGSGAARRARR